MNFSADGTKVQCHACGEWLGSLNSHLRLHGLDKHGYKDLYDLPRRASLLPPVTKSRYRDAALARDQGDVGRAHLPHTAGRPAGQTPRLGVRISASRQRQGIYTHGGEKTMPAGWTPDHHDWEADPRPLADCLKAWHARPGWTRDRAASELRVPRATYDGWCAGRTRAHEGPIRRLMTLIDRTAR